MDELLKDKPELHREELMKRIEEKKSTVGAGYLTDQGALFLVAGELGVQLQRPPVGELALKDLYIGANDVTVIGRVLAIYPTATYHKKDGGEGRYKRLVIFDGGGSAKLTLWEERVDDVEKSGLAVGDPVRVSNGYVKQGLDGKPVLNLGRRGGLGLAQDGAGVDSIPSLDGIVEKLGALDSERQFLAIDCVVASVPRFSEFVRSDGSGGSLFQFTVSSPEGGKERRVVIWSPAEKPELKEGEKIRLTNVRVRRSSRGEELEIHGDAGSVIIPAGSGGKEMRVISVLTRAGRGFVVAVDKEKRAKVIETEFNLTSLTPDKVVSVRPDQESDALLVCRTPSALTVKDAARFPPAEMLATKLKDARDEKALVMVEVIALSHGAVEEVNLKDGSVAKKGDLMVSDDTAEMKLVAWREQAPKLKDIQPGERLRVAPVSPKATKMGAWTLQVNERTVIEKLRAA